VPAQAATVPAEPAPPVAVAQQPALAAPSAVSATEEPPLVQAVLALPPPKAAEPTPPPVESITPDAELTWPEVLEIQRRLVSLGVNPGPLDGISGPRTMAGVQRYQELKGLAVTGKANRGMLKLLQQDSASSATLEARAQ
jgi:peptidoglycan hydrolase-like protein with peptidoglycan-binding domain